MSLPVADVVSVVQYSSMERMVSLVVVVTAIV